MIWSGLAGNRKRVVGSGRLVTQSYGAGDAKIGSIINKGSTAGKRLKEAFLKQLPALAKLKEAVELAVDTRGFLRGLDGRKLPVRSKHSALNTLLQSAGALLMKEALVILDETLQGLRLVPGVHYEFLLNVHDEWQIEVLDGSFHEMLLVDKVRRCAEWSIGEAGRRFDFRCPLRGSSAVGNSWADTH